MFSVLVKNLNENALCFCSIEDTRRCHNSILCNYL